MVVTGIFPVIVRAGPGGDHSWERKVVVRNESPTGAKNLLIVDDEPQARSLLKRILDAAGYGCTLASDASQGRRRLEEQPFDLLLCDVLMPGESG
ncbi:TPA: response regulator, partial [Candidatus Micrarchaeota archaeon]|nr:response regulator [Candidatus Micrarchaeota archaeon]